MLKTQGPLVDALTKNLNAAVDSGVLAEVVSRATGDIFKALNMGGQGDAVTGIMARVLAFAEVVPGNLAKGIAFLKDFTLAAINNVSEFFRMAEDRVGRFMARLALMTQAGQMLSEGIQSALENPFAASKILASTFADINAVSNAADMASSASPGYTPQYKSLPGLPSFAGMDGSRVAEIEARLKKQMLTTPGGIADASGQGFLRRDLGGAGDAQKQVDDKLAKIVQATETTAKNTSPDLAESIFGGRRSKGISYADVLGGSAGRGGAIQIRTDKAETTLGQALLQVLQENMPEIWSYYERRAGWAN
jgi:hypothetical protein